MRKILILVISFFTLSINSYSQIDYVNNTDIIIKRVKNNLFTITKIQDDSTILYTGVLESKKPIIRSGVFSFYTPSGYLEAVGNYAHNVLVGEWIYFNHRIDSDGKVHYDTLDIVDYDVIHKYINIKNEVPVSKEWLYPTFNGGNPMIEFKKYVKENMIYPAYAKYEGIEGSVLLQIKIDEEGNVVEPNVVRSNFCDFTIEALRLVVRSKDWGPVIQNGKPIAVVINLTIDFRLQ
jgi:TonB family protein